MEKEIKYEIIEYVNETGKEKTLLETTDVEEVEAYLKNNIDTIPYRDIRIEVRVQTEG